MALAKCLGACEINDGNGFASPSCTHNFETGGRGKGHPIYILNFRIALRDILRFRVIAVYFADTGPPNHTRLSTPSLTASHVEFLDCEHVATKSTCRLATHNLQTNMFVFKDYDVP